jgi:hypothetical protein
VEAVDNVFDTQDHLLAVFQGKPIVRGREAEAVLPRLMDWHDQGNVYSKGIRHFVTWHYPVPELPVPDGSIKSWKEWLQFGNATSGSVQGFLRYRGGNILAKLNMEAEKVTAEDCRLRPESAGYRAVKGGHDLGIQADLVGPGPAYGRWRKTPRYQKWLRDSGQVDALPR